MPSSIDNAQRCLNILNIGFYSCCDLKFRCVSEGHANVILPGSSTLQILLSLGPLIQSQTLSLPKVKRMQRFTPLGGAQRGGAWPRLWTHFQRSFRLGVGGADHFPQATTTVPTTAI